MLPVPDSLPRPPYLGPYSPRHPSEGLPLHEYSNDEKRPRHIEVKTPDALERMRAAGALAREALELAGRAVDVGVRTEELDALVHEFACARGAYPSPLGYMGFPKAICTSVNDVLLHGIPDDRPLEEGDVVNVDVTLFLDGYHGDTSCMFFAGRPKKRAARLCAAGQQAMKAGIRACGPGQDFRCIGAAIEKKLAELSVDGEAYYSSHSLAGHGIGTYFHGAPHVLHFENDLDQGLMKPGMVFTVEPVILEGTSEQFKIKEDDWTCQSLNGAWSSQFEHTVLITETGTELLTGPSLDYRAIAKEKFGKAVKKGSGGFSGKGN